MKNKGILKNAFILTLDLGKIKILIQIQVNL